MDQTTVYLLLAGIFGLFMAWGIGANDVANAMATSVGSKAITFKNAIIIAAIFEFAGAVLAGGEVTSTIRKGMVDPEIFSQNPTLLIHGMLAALLAAGSWLMIASRLGWPVSTTHSIVGAIVGFTIAGAGFEAVKWSKVGAIALSWIASPLSAGLVAYILYKSAEKFILNTANPLANAIRYIPFYVFLTGLGIALVTLTKGLKHIGLELTLTECYIIAVVIAIIVSLISVVVLRKRSLDTSESAANQLNMVERQFAFLMVITACAMAFAHGSNDVANAIGPVAAIVSTLKTGSVTAEAALPLWVLLLGGVGIVIGLSTYGLRVLRVVGERITELTPSRGFAAELAAALTVVFASAIGMPISTTHTLIGAIVGVGLARHYSEVDAKMMGRIGLSWVITLPSGAGLAILFFTIFQHIL